LEHRNHKGGEKEVVQSWLEKKAQQPKTQKNVFAIKAEVKTKAEGQLRGGFWKTIRGEEKWHVGL